MNEQNKKQQDKLFEKRIKTSLKNRKNKIRSDSNDKKQRKSPQQKQEICTVRKLISKEDKNSRKSNRKLGFFIPKENIFVPCDSQEEYYYLKHQIMSIQLAKTGGQSYGFCFEKKDKKDSQILSLNRSVVFQNQEFYDGNSNMDDMEHIQFM